MLYDITTKENSLKTLANLTNFKYDYWEHSSFVTTMQGKNIDKALNDIIRLHDLKIDFNLDEIDFVVEHITTSNNACRNIQQYGLRDLKSVYMDTTSELRDFLDKKQISIDLPNKQIYFNGKVCSIDYNSISNAARYDYDCIEHKLWSVGRKFYYDFCICGFLCTSKNDTYGGYVHLRPEILNDITKIFNADLSSEWHFTHSAYCVKFKVPYTNVINVFSEHDNPDKIRNNLLYRAFRNTMYESTDELLLKDNIEVLSEAILEISPFTKWD